MENTLTPFLTLDDMQIYKLGEEFNSYGFSVYKIYLKSPSESFCGSILVTGGSGPKYQFISPNVPKIVFDPIDLVEIAEFMIELNEKIETDMQVTN